MPLILVPSEVSISVWSFERRTWLVRDEIVLIAQPGSTAGALSLSRVAGWERGGQTQCGQSLSGRKADRWGSE